MPSTQTNEESKGRIQKTLSFLEHQSKFKIRTKITARETLKQYMKIFNLGRGMPLHYQVKENKPDGWPDSISFEDFKGVSFAKKEEATQIIEALIRYYAKVEPDDDVVSSEDEVIGYVENVESIVNDG